MVREMNVFQDMFKREGLEERIQKKKKKPCTDIIRKDILCYFESYAIEAFNDFLFLRPSPKQIIQGPPQVDLFKPVFQNSLSGILYSNPPDLSTSQILTHLICMKCL